MIKGLSPFLWRRPVDPAGGDGHAQGDVCRRSDGIEFRECGDELAQAKICENLEFL